MNSPSCLERQTVATLQAGLLKSAIPFFTNYGYGALLHIRTATLDEQLGVCLHASTMAALFGDAELATH